MRLKYFVLAGMMLVLSLAAVSCGEDKTPIIDNSWNSGNLSVTEEVLLSKSNTQSINIKAASKPTLTCEAEWLKIGEVKRISTGLYTVELTAEPNVSGEPRTTEITVTDGKETATVKLTQESSDMVEIRSVLPEGNLNPAGGTLTIKYVATGTPATNLPDWMKEVKSRGLVEGELNLTYSANNTGRVREGVIVLAVGKDAIANLTVHQEAVE